MRIILSVGLAVVLLATAVKAADDYVPGPDSLPQPGVPKGEVTKYTFSQSKIFPGTVRDYWVYVPKQYDPAKPACLMVFQDGIQYSAPVVFDNLINKKEIPVIIGIFIMHGRVEAPNTNALDRFNRSYEYDGLGDNYVRFLTEELLPEVTNKYNISTNADDRGIAGASSGAIAAFTAAWERPDVFRRVFSSVGTYVGLRGGDVYPTLIRKTEPKPIRIFLQDGSADQNIYGGNWFLANQEMLSALEFSGYEVNHIWGDGGHNGKQATAVFPDALRWLWKDYPAPVTAGRGSKQPITDILLPGEDWKLAAPGRTATGALAVNTAGEVYFADPVHAELCKIDASGVVSVFASIGGDVEGLAFEDEGSLIASQPSAHRLTRFDKNGKSASVGGEINAAELAISSKHQIFFSDPDGQSIGLVLDKGTDPVVRGGTGFGAVQLTPDQTLLLIADPGDQFVYSAQVQTWGSVSFLQKYFYLHLADGARGSGARGMTVDTKGRLYVTTDLGIQVCDQPGRVNCIISKPAHALLSHIAFGGADLSELYVTCGGKIFHRKTKAAGVLSAQAPVKPPKPGL